MDIGLLMVMSVLIAVIKRDNMTTEEKIEEIIEKYKAVVLINGKDEIIIYERYFIKILKEIVEWQRKECADKFGTLYSEIYEYILNAGE